MVLVQPFVFATRHQRVWLDAAHAQLPGAFERVDPLVGVAQLPHRRWGEQPPFEGWCLLIRIGDDAARDERRDCSGTGKSASR